MRSFLGALTEMPSKTSGTSVGELRDGARCEVVGGTHAGKAGTVRDITVGAKHGQQSITVLQDDGSRFKTLAKNVRILD